MSIRILNVRLHGGPKGPNEVYVGRHVPGRTHLKPSPLGNKPGKGLPLSEALARYREFLEDLVEKRDTHSQALKELRRLCALNDEHEELILLCWCAPAAGWTTEDKPYRCHAQIIAEFIEREDRAFWAIMAQAYHEGRPVTEADIAEENLPELTDEERKRLDEIDIEEIIQKETED